MTDSGVPRVRTLDGPRDEVRAQGGGPDQSPIPPVDVVAPALTSAPLMSQRWCDLAFLHWFVRPERVAAVMPAGAAPDVVPHGRFAGTTPVALVPFRMADAGFGGGPGIPFFGAFWETNVRLYSVDATGWHGVVFCSLDASRPAVVLAARMTLGLPYRYSRMRGYRRTRDGARELAWTARTRWPGPAGIGSRVVVRVGDPLPTAAPGAQPDAEGENYDAKGGLAAFLTARWGLHTAVLRRTWYLPNVHEPWSLRSLELLLLDDGLLAAAGFGDLAGRPPDHACFAEGVRTRFGWPLVVADRR